MINKSSYNIYTEPTLRPVLSIICNVHDSVSGAVCPPHANQQKKVNCFWPQFWIFFILSSRHCVGTNNSYVAPSLTKPMIQCLLVDFLVKTKNNGQLLHNQQTWCSQGCSTNTFVINWFSHSDIARDLKFWDNVHHPHTSP